MMMSESRIAPWGRAKLAVMAVTVLSGWLALGSTASAADVIDPELERVELELKIHQIVVESLREPDVQALADDAVPTRLSQIAENVLEVAVGGEEIRLPEKRSLLRQIVQKASWSTIWNGAKGAVKEVRSTARLHGRTVAMWTALGIGLEVLNPIICLAFGSPQLYPLIVPFVPGPWFTTGIGLFLSRVQLHKRLCVLYGGCGALTEFRKIMREARAAYGMVRPDDWVVPIDAEEGRKYSLVVRRSGLFSSVLRWVGIKSRGVSLQEVIAWAEGRQWKTERVKRLSEIASLSESTRILLLVQHLLGEHGQVALETLRERFPESTLPTPRVNELPETFTRWVMTVRKSESWNQLVEAIHAMPKESSQVDPRVFWAIWKKQVLPALADEMGQDVTVSRFRKLVSESEVQVAMAATGRGNREYKGTLEVTLAEIDGLKDCDLPLVGAL